jgi:ammonium transporter, Amt family
LEQFSYWQHGYHTYDVVYTMNGCLTGLAAITGPCASVDTWAAVIIGIGSGIVYTAGSKLMIKLRIDDAVCICRSSRDAMWALDLSEFSLVAG